MDDHQRPRNGSVEGHGMNFRSLSIDDELFLLGDEFELHNPWTLLSCLLVWVHKWRRNELYFFTRQVEVLSQRGRREDESAQGDARRLYFSHDHESLLWYCRNRQSNCNEKLNCLCCSRDKARVPIHSSFMIVISST